MTRRWVRRGERSWYRVVEVIEIGTRGQGGRTKPLRVSSVGTEAKRGRLEHGGHGVAWRHLGCWVRVRAEGGRSETGRSWGCTELPGVSGADTRAKRGSLDGGLWGRAKPLVASGASTRAEGGKSKPEGDVGSHGADEPGGMGCGYRKGRGVDVDCRASRW